MDPVVVACSNVDDSQISELEEIEEKMTFRDEIGQKLLNCEAVVYTSR